MRVAQVIAVWCLVSGPAFGAELSGTVHAAGKPTQYAIVWLDAPDAPPPIQSARVTIDQRNLDFFPHVVAIRVGTAVEFPNKDRLFHNVFSFRDGKKFDLGMYPAGAASKAVIFDKPGLSRIFCNIHPHMAAYVMAVDTPYFSISDALGAFSIKGVPAGNHTYHAWRPGGETLTGTVTVDSDHPLDIRWP